MEQVREMVSYCIPNNHQLVHMQDENLSHVRSDDFVAGIHKLEVLYEHNLLMCHHYFQLERIKYVLCSYLRTRLKKVPGLKLQIMYAVYYDILT